MAGARSSLGFAAATLVIGVSFGVTARASLGVVATIAMSALLFAGAAQFGAVAVLASGGGVVAAVVAGAMLNARFLPMGVAAAPALRGPRWRRALEGQAIVDVSWALAARGARGFDRELMLGAMPPQYLAWVLGTALGAFLGAGIGDPASVGIDEVLPAFLLVLVAADARRPGAVAVALTGGAIALVLSPLLPAGLPVLAASAAAAIGLRR